MRILLLTAAVALVAAPVLAQPSARARSGDALASARPGEITVSGSGSRQRASCNGGTATVAGSRNVAELTGACDHVMVGGSDNEIRVALASGARVTVGGSRNTVRWTAPRGGRPPQITRAGTDNVVEPARGS